MIGFNTLFCVAFFSSCINQITTILCFFKGGLYGTTECWQQTHDEKADSRCAFAQYGSICNSLKTWFWILETWHKWLTGIIYIFEVRFWVHSVAVKKYDYRMRTMDNNKVTIQSHHSKHRQMYLGMMLLSGQLLTHEVPCDITTRRARPSWWTAGPYGTLP